MCPHQDRAGDKMAVQEPAPGELSGLLPVFCTLVRFVPLNDIAYNVLD